MRELLLSFADHLGVSPDDAAPVLEEALAALADDFAAAGRATLDGVGTFAATPTGPRFEPDELLLATVNSDYAGLGPLAEPAPIAVPFLSAFPVVPVMAEDAVAEPIPTDGVAQEEEAAPVVDGPAGRTSDDALDDDLAAAMEDAWTAPSSPPVARLEPTNVRIAGGDTIAFEDADFTFVPSPAGLTAPGLEHPASPFPTIASPAPFAATATTQPAAPLVPLTYAEERERRSALWWAVPLVAVVAVGAWLFTRSDGVPAPTGEPPAGEVAESGNGGRTSAASGGGAVGERGNQAQEPAGGPLPADGAAQVPEATQSMSEEAASEGAGGATTPPPPPPVAQGATASPSEPTRTEPPQPATDRTASATPIQPRTAPRQPARRPVRETASATPGRTTPPVSPATPSPAGTLYGLTGTGSVDPAAGGVTWILNSTSASEAAGQADRYRSLGFRSAVLTAIVDGRRVYRVAVGQFPGIAEARAARSLLPSDAPADAWILRLGNAP